MDLKKLYLLDKIKRLFPEYKLSINTDKLDNNNLVSKINKILDITEQNQPPKASFSLCVETYGKNHIVSNSYSSLSKDNIIQAISNDMNTTISFHTDIDIYVTWKWIFYLPEQNIYKFSLNTIRFFHSVFCERRLNFDTEIITSNLETLQTLTEKIIQNIAKYEILVLLKGNLTKNQRYDISKIVKNIINEYKS